MNDLLSYTHDGDIATIAMDDGKVNAMSIPMLEALHAVPVALDSDQVVLRLDGGRERGLAYDRIEAVAVAAVRELGPKPVLIVDLALNWMGTVEQSLRVVRIRTDRMDPRQLMPGADTPVNALRSLVELLIERADAASLPDRDAVLGHPYAVFDTLDDYQRTVLMVESDDEEKSGSS